MTERNVPVPVEQEEDVLGQIVRALMDFLGQVPTSGEPPSSGPPLARAQAVANAAAMKAAAVSTTLALPPGPFGMLTVLPDLVAIWKIQAQMVADIASTYDKSAYLTKEQMLYCLFRHAAAQAVRDLVVRVGERMLIRRVSLRVFQRIVQRVGVRITQRVVSKVISRWLPIIGALGVGAYAYYDTGQVAATAIELFSSEIDIETDPEDAA